MKKNLLITCLSTFIFTSSLAQSNTATPSANSDREIFIDLGRAGERKMRMAIPQIVVVGGAGEFTGADAEQYSKRLGSIFDFTGAFEIMDPKAFLSKPGDVAKAPDFEQWSTIKAETLIFGKIDQADKGRLGVELKLFHVGKRRTLLGKRYSNVAKQDMDRVLRRFADLCVEALTGEMGIFSSKIAFVGAKTLGKSKQVYIADFDGSNLKAITDNNSINLSPSWSPDGTKLTYTSFKEGKADIYVYNMLTNRTQKLTNSIGNNSGAAWQPNGSKIAFASGQNGKTEIYTISTVSGSNKEPLITGSGLEVEPAFSPDGGKISFASGRFGNPHIFIRDLLSGKDTRITFAGWYNSSPSWRPDGRKLAFAGWDREIGRYDIFMVNPDGRQMERLTLDQGDNEKPSWSPDGRFISFQSNRLPSGRGKQRGYKLYTMNRDGADQKALNIPLADVIMPSWGPRLNELDD